MHRRKVAIEIEVKLSNIPNKQNNIFSCIAIQHTGTLQIPSPLDDLHDEIVLRIDLRNIPRKFYTHT